MTEMVEKVARAIAAAKRAPELRTPEIIGRAWVAYCGQARAAIAAMSEPSGMMLEAGLIALVSEIERFNEPRVRLTEAQTAGEEPIDDETMARRYMDMGAIMRNSVEVKAAYRAMIAAALSSGSPLLSPNEVSAGNPATDEHHG